MSKSPATTSSKIKQSNITAIKQTNKSIPQEVKDLYTRNPKTRQKLYQANKIQSYFKGKADDRTLTFDNNRQPSVNTNLVATKTLKPLNEDEFFLKAQHVSGEAKAIAVEINNALLKKDVSHAQLVTLNTKMMLKVEKV